MVSFRRWEKLIAKSTGNTVAEATMAVFFGASSVATSCIGISKLNKACEFANLADDVIRRVWATCSSTYAFFSAKARLCDKLAPWLIGLVGESSRG